METLKRLASLFPVLQHAQDRSALELEREQLRERVETLANQVLALRSDLEGQREAYSILEAEHKLLKEDSDSRKQAEAFWVPPGHFYSPLADPLDETVQRCLDMEAHPGAPLSVFGIDENLMMRWFDTIAGWYAAHAFPEQRTAGCRYFYGNPNFPLADAVALLAFMAECRPSRFVEIGAGYSSCAAMDVNDRYLDSRVHILLIEPNPELIHGLIGSHFAGELFASKIQDVGLEVFRELRAGDILFIDSSHVAKIGSDVLDYTFRILPALAPGVIVHVHDIFFPFEYPRAWVVDENRSWNEAYLLRAFLHGNPSFRVLYFSDWFYKCKRALVESRMPLCVTHRGGSIWLEKVDL